MIFISTDILNPYKREILSKDRYETLIDFLIAYYPDGFENPVDISINGKIIDVENYDIKLGQYDIIVMLDRTALPVGLIGGWFITALANLAISVTLSYVANKLFAPDEPAAQAQPSSVYNVTSGQNTAKFGSPVPIIYGKVRMYPSMIVQPYYRYDNNLEYLYHTLCVSQGTCIADAINIADDEITSEGDLEWKFLYKEDFYNIPLNGLGYHITKTLSNPSNMELDAGVESEKYQISADAKDIEFDYIFPAGLIYTNSDGESEPTTWGLTYKIYDFSDIVVGSGTVWTSAQSRDAIRKTFTIDASGFTEDVYISFTKNVNPHPNRVEARLESTLLIRRLKAIYPNEDFTQNYGDVTLLVCKIKATNAVSAAGQVKVNGYFERTDVGNTMHEVLTDIYTNTNYGGALNADDLDFPITTETVNCAYESNQTIFDAMRKPALAQGYSVYLAGMDVILKKDGPNEVTSGMYNEQNILSNSLKVQYLFKEEFPTYDGFEVTYIDGCGWIPRSEKYPSWSTRPQTVDLFGVVDYTCEGLPPLEVHLFDMIVTATAEPLWYAFEGVLTYDDLGDGRWHIWSDDSITRIELGGDKTVITHVTVVAASTLDRAAFAFNGAPNLVFLDLSGWDMTLVTTVEGMIRDSPSIPNLDLSPCNLGPNLTSMRRMAWGATSLEWINLTGVGTGNVTNFEDFVRDCTSLVCMSNLSTIAGTTKDDMFLNTPLLAAPNATDQTDLSDIDGATWVNPSPCP